MTVNEFGAVVPVLRMFDLRKTREFYLEFLRFTVDWEHRFEPKLPLYMQISRGGVQIHLTEHYGDATPGSMVRIETPRIQALHTELITRVFSYSRPAVEKKPWGHLEMTVTDPSGNRIVFFEVPKPVE